MTFERWKSCHWVRYFIPFCGKSDAWHWHHQRNNIQYLVVTNYQWNFFLIKTLPNIAQNRFLWGGNRKTSVWMIFHPFSSESSASASSSSTLYRAKSLFNTRVWNTHQRSQCWRYTISNNNKKYVCSTCVLTTI